MAEFPSLSRETAEILHDGVVIPAHPLALTEGRRLDERHQRGLSRYYLHAGAGGLAVGVHTTQFAIRDAKHGLLRPVLEIAADVVRSEAKKWRKAPEKVLLVAGVCGNTNQAVAEAQLAMELGYDLGLLSLAALPNGTEDELIAHCEEVARVIPLFGFYLQPDVGGRVLGYSFWRRFAEIPNVSGVKVAPFNRYRTNDVIRGIGESSRWGKVALYTGNDDSIVTDLISNPAVETHSGIREMRFAGGLLGHWACWTQKAVALLQRCQQTRSDLHTGNDPDQIAELLRMGHQVTEMNAALFDAANDFRGCIAGIQEVLAQQGLLRGPWTLDSSETLSPGQAAEILRVRKHYPHLIDDDFVQANLQSWLGN